jgi:hypothetical protein
MKAIAATLILCPFLGTYSPSMWITAAMESSLKFKANFVV